MLIQVNFTTWPHNKSLCQEQRKLRAEIKQKKKDEEEERKAKSRAGKGRGRGRGRGKLVTEPTETTGPTIPPADHQDGCEDTLSMEAALEERDQEMQAERDNENDPQKKKKRRKAEVEDKSAGSKASPPKAEQVTKDPNTVEKDEKSEPDKGESKETEIEKKAGDIGELELGDGVRK